MKKWNLSIEFRWYVDFERERMMDERFLISDAEREKVLGNYFRQGLNGPIDVFPSKEKRKYIIAQEIIKRFEADKMYIEKEINELLRTIHPDFATIRRFLIDYRFMNRSDDGKQYWIEGNYMKIHRNVELDAVKLFVENVFVENIDLKQDFYASMQSRMNDGVYFFENENGITIAISTHSSTWHPHCVYVRLAYDFKCFDERAICFILDFLKDEFKKPLFFLIDDRSSRLSELLKKRNFQLIRKTEIVNIEPEKCCLENDASQKEIETVSQIVNDPALLSSLIELCKKTYTETHVDNPVANLPNSSWEDVIMADLLNENSYVVLNGKRVIAFSLMYKGIEGCWELGWLGVDDGTDIYLLDLILKQQLHDANEHNVSFIEKEVDSTCPYSLHVVQLLSYEVSETCYAYIEK
ncbi:DUF2087 domain-containing protein [Sporosarcina limicola]|uniref:DUF2087 domain-containing protein n=1 Tax=Sporosarcina limicola TaxID=34101 RepID=A0A927MI32_9BACL|nr:DUF2087 domain-containing protein [Sporosarcina limicola]MBE1554196.1 hypothetical protein [Sporosarcina limicola]